MKSYPAYALAVSTMVFTAATCPAIVFTIEAPGVQSTTVASAVTETFNDPAVGPVANYASPTVGGTYHGGSVAAADIYGGANGSQYLDIGSRTSATLVFDTPKTYFGMWWSAGDPSNRLTFYDPSSSVLAQYLIGDILPLLGPAYFGNPNDGSNLGEAYVYLNFTAVPGESIERILFESIGPGGFESDNHSVLETYIDPPGNPPGVVPDATSTLPLLAGGLALFTCLFRRKFTV